MIVNNRIRIVKVISKNFVGDFWAKIQNIIGKNLTGYEKMVEKGLSQIDEELLKENVKLKWFRYETTELTKGAIMIVFYGEVE